MESVGDLGGGDDCLDLVWLQIFSVPLFKLEALQRKPYLQAPIDGIVVRPQIICGVERLARRTPTIGKVTVEIFGG